MSNMKLRQPRRKKHCNHPKNEPFPPENAKYTGRFNGVSVVIDNFDEMSKINSMGFFGKGNFSRSFPCYAKQRKPIFLRKRQLALREQWMETMVFPKKENVIVVNDSDSETEDFCNNLNSTLIETCALNETLNLTLEEAYFLASAIGCLVIYDFDNKLLDLDTVWLLFCETQENFIQNYVVYYYFRSRNWVVKTGLKFGGDFLLYKQGPPFYHASYLIIIDVLNNETLERNSEISKRPMKWANLIGLNRLTETAAKEVVISQVLWPKNLSLDTAKLSRNILKQFSVNTILVRRWIAKQERIK